MPRCFIAIDRSAGMDLADTLRVASEAMTLGGSRERSFQLVRPPFAALVLSHGEASPFTERNGELLIDLGVWPAAGSFMDFADACGGFLAAGEADDSPPELAPAPMGRQCLVRWSPSRGELLIITEPNGQSPLYYFTSPARTLVASEVKAIWAAAPGALHPDADGLLEFHHSGHLLAERTLFREIRGAPPGTILGFGSAGLRTRAYYSPRFSDGHGGDSRRAAADLNRSLGDVLHACRPAVPRVTAALSGGMDSRYLLAGAKGVWEDLDSITFGSQASLDTTLAREVAAKAHVRHRHFSPAEDFLSDWAGHAVWRADGMLSCLHAQGMDAVITCAGESRHILNGMGGDLLMGAFLRAGHLLWPGDPMRAARFLSRGSRRSFDQVFKPEVLAEATTRPDVTLGEIVRRYPHERLGNILTCFWLRHRCAHVTALGVSLEAPHVEYLTPLADASFVRAATGLSLEQRFMCRTYRRALGLLAPELATICWERVGLAPRWPWPALALSKLGRRFGIPPRPRPAVDYPRQFRTTLRPWLEAILLDRAALEEGYFLPDYLRRIVREHGERAGDHTTEIGLALTIELWRRMFVERRLALAEPPGRPAIESA